MASVTSSLLRNGSIFELQPLEIRRFLTTASVDSNHVLNINGTSASDNILVDLRTSDGRVTISGFSGSFSPGSTGSTQFNQINIHGNDGNDVITIDSSVPYNSASVFGGNGNDTLTGGSGDDSLVGEANDDMLDGGPTGADTLNGGSGEDTSNYSYRGLGLKITLDGVANDGSSLGAEGDNVMTEEVITGSGKDSITGGSGADFLAGGAAGDSIRGGSGDDLLTGSSGSDTMLGETGDDALQAQNQDADVVNGGTNTDGTPDFDVAQIDAGLDTGVLPASATSSALRSLLQTAGGSALDPSSLDTTYGTQGKAIGPDFNWSSITAATVDSAGRVIIVGTQFGDGTGGDMVVSRYTADGTLDDSFGNGGVVTIDFTPVGSNAADNDAALGVVADNSGKIYVVGTTVPNSQQRSDTDIAVARLDASGNLDNSYGVGGKFTTDLTGGEFAGLTDDSAEDAALQSDGKLVLAINSTFVDGGSSDVGVMRLTNGGTLDDSFGGGMGFSLVDVGDGSEDFARAIALQKFSADNGAQRIVIGGSTGGSMLLARFTPSGDLDTTFDGDGFITDGIAGNFSAFTDVAVDGANRIAAVGSTSVVIGLRDSGNLIGGTSGVVGIYNQNGNGGNPDASSGQRLLVDGDAFTGVAVDSSQRIVVVGTDGNDVVVGRYTSKLTPDTSFNGGNFTTIDFTDPGDSIGNNDDALFVSVRPNGKIIVAGIDDQNNDGDIREVAARLLGDNIKGAEQDVTEVEGFFNDDELFSQPPQDPIAPYLDRLTEAGKFYVLSQPRADGSAVIQLTDHYKHVSFSVVTDGDGNKVLAVNVDNLVLYYDPKTTTVLKILGTDGTDNIIGNDTISVPMMVFGNGGDDVIVGGRGNDQLHGGSGDDQINGGKGNDALFGDAGNDNLVGEDGRDLLVGGTGSDRLVGSTDEDILVGGTTSYDNNTDAITAIMNEWSSGATFNTRVSHLRNGGGLNGSFVLTTGPSGTVFDDNASDKLTGSNGPDWLFARLNGPNSDKITDLSLGEDVLSSL